MKILVCVSKTPDTTTTISLTADNTKINTEGIQYIMNPYDEWYALVRALELTEDQEEDSTTILNVGPPANDPVIRKGLAIGADEAVRINAEPKSSLTVARLIANYAKPESFDMIFFGKETIDYNGSEVGAMVAELLDLPFISYASHLELNENTATIKRDIEGGVEIVEVDTPFVISASKGLAKQRIPNMRGIMNAKRKPLNVVEAEPTTDEVVAVKYELPPAKGQVKLVDPENMDELVRLLHEEAKVI